MRPDSRSRHHIPIDDISEDEIEKDIKYVKSGLNGVVEPRELWTSTDALADRLDGELAAEFDNSGRLEEIPDYSKDADGDDVLDDVSYESYLGKAKKTLAKGKDAGMGVDDEFEKLKAISSRLDTEDVDELSQSTGGLDKTRGRKLGSPSFSEDWVGEGKTGSDRASSSHHLSDGGVVAGFKSSSRLDSPNDDAGKERFDPKLREHQAGKIKTAGGKPSRLYNEPVGSASKSSPHLDKDLVGSASNSSPHLDKDLVGSASNSSPHLGNDLVGSASRSSPNLKALIEEAVRRQFIHLYGEHLMEKMNMAGDTSTHLEDVQVDSGINALAEGGDDRERSGFGTTTKLTTHTSSTQGSSTRLLKALAAKGVKHKLKMNNSHRTGSSLRTIHVRKLTTARTLRLNESRHSFDVDSFEMLTNGSSSSHGYNKTVIVGNDHEKSSSFSSLHGRQGVIIASSVVAFVTVIFLAFIIYKIVVRIKRNSNKNQQKYLTLSTEEDIVPVERPRERSYSSTKKKKKVKKKHRDERVDPLNVTPLDLSLSPVLETDYDEEDSEYNDEEDTLFIKGGKLVKRK